MGALVLGLTGTTVLAAPFKETRLIIEFNSSAQDIGVQFFLDADGWEEIAIFNPERRLIFEAETSGKLLRQGGGTELFVESEEPPLTELPLEDFFALFPEGSYRFLGSAVDGTVLRGSAMFTHDIPAGPEIVLPVQGADCDDGGPVVPLPVDIAWNAVATSIDGEPIDVVAYQVIVESFEVTLPASAPTMTTVPSGLLEPGTPVLFEILAIEEGGNQTITEGCFVTAD